MAFECLYNKKYCLGSANWLKLLFLHNCVYVRSLNPLSLNSDKNEISLYIITTFLNIQVLRIKDVITKDQMSWYLDKFSLLVP